MAQTLTDLSEPGSQLQQGPVMAPTVEQIPEAELPDTTPAEASYPGTDAELRTYLQATPLRMRPTAYLDALVANQSTPAAMATTARDELDRRESLEPEALAREDTLRTEHQRRRRRTVDERGQTGPDLNK
ncbi:Uncharacterised protein [Mycobacteroides abscessus subsp. massiliense]|nr:Uncharacterised protein [Mycobacteroides abscessus subsp. massiliense]